MPIAPPNDDHNTKSRLRDRIAQWILVRLYGGWKPRTQIPPKGRLWASDGKAVWAIWTDGGPIPKEATAVLFWMPHPMPDPPPPSLPIGET